METKAHVNANYLNNSDFLKKLSESDLKINRYYWFAFISLILFGLSADFKYNYVFLAYGIFGLIIFLAVKFHIFHLSYVTKLVFFDEQEIKQTKTKDKFYLGYILLFLQTWWIFLLFALFRIYLIEPMIIPSESMLPDMKVGDIVYVNKLDKDKIKNGDVVVFNYPLNPSDFYIKRLIAKQGDEFEVYNNDITVNGQKITGKEIGRVMYSFNGKDVPMIMQHEGNYKIAQLAIYDNMKTSFPSKDVFTGKENCEIFERNHLKCKMPENYYFLVGDNRDNSNDGRYWGFVHYKDIIGSVHKKNLFEQVQ